MATWRLNAGDDQAGFGINKIIGGAGWSYPKHSHQEHCELVCATKGKFLHIINRQKTVQKAGEMILIRQTDVHELSGRQFIFVNVAFPTDWLVRLGCFMEMPAEMGSLLSVTEAPRVQIPRQNLNEYRQALDRLLEHSSSRAGRRHFAQFLLTAVTKHLKPYVERDFSPEWPDWLRDTLTWLNQQHDPFPTVQALVKRSYHCHEHFTRQFSRCLGITPSRYLAGLKVDRAARMLVTTNHELLEICHAAGFENESYFFRLFRQRKGMSPLAYRKTHGPHGIQR